MPTPSPPRCCGGRRKGTTTLQMVIRTLGASGEFQVTIQRGREHGEVQGGHSLPRTAHETEDKVLLPWPQYLPG